MILFDLSRLLIYIVPFTICISSHERESGFKTPAIFCEWNPDSGKILLVESGILSLGIRNTAQGIRNLSNDWDPEYKFHWQKLGIQYFPYMGWICFLFVCLFLIIKLRLWIFPFSGDKFRRIKPSVICTQASKHILYSSNDESWSLLADLTVILHWMGKKKTKGDI